MTTPKPDQMRALADRATALSQRRHSPMAVLLREHVAALRAAADEVDRLRESCATWKRLANDERDVTDRLRAKLDIVGAHDMHLRAVIENAPHGSSCGCHVGADGLLTGEPCTCWKADAP